MIYSSLSSLDLLFWNMKKKTFCVRHPAHELWRFKVLTVFMASLCTHTCTSTGASSRISKYGKCTFRICQHFWAKINASPNGEYAHEQLMFEDSFLILSYRPHSAYESVNVFQPNLHTNCLSKREEETETLNNLWVRQAYKTVKQFEPKITDFEVVISPMKRTTKQP